jgi:VCBS repeat-containing protein
VISITATPDTLWPPNGKLVSITVSGTITDEDSDVDAITATYEVEDEYGSVQPKGSVPVKADGTYSFTIDLKASRNGSDKNGRQYTITVRARDTEGNEGSAATSVTVPHDQGQSRAAR